MRSASWMSLGMSVTRLACIAHRFASSNRTLRLHAVLLGYLSAARLRQQLAAGRTTLEGYKAGLHAMRQFAEALETMSAAQRTAKEEAQGPRAGEGAPAPGAGGAAVDEAEVRRVVAEMIAEKKGRAAAQGRRGGAWPSKEEKEEVEEEKEEGSDEEAEAEEAQESDEALVGQAQELSALMGIDPAPVGEGEDGAVMAGEAVSDDVGVGPAGEEEDASSEAMTGPMSDHASPYRRAVRASSCSQCATAARARHGRSRAAR